MKRIFKNFMALSLGLALVAAGCSKDDNYAKEIAGKYTGTIAVSGQVVAQNVAINVTEKNETTVELSLNTTIPQALQGQDLPLNVTCDATVAKSGDNYTIAGNTSITLPGSDSSLPVTVAGTITAAGKADLTIGITVGIPLSAVFSGTKQ